jgi:peptidoglycan L-alanyl-D-glutamate endopeptidase CwlK
MLIFIALLYFCVACSLIWLACFPTGRALINQLMFGLRSRLERVTQRRPGLPSHALPQLPHLRDLRALAKAFVKTMRRNWIVLAIVVPAVAIPLAGAGPAHARHAARLRADRGAARCPDRRAAAGRTTGAAGPDPPPLAFSTQEVVQVRPMLVNASRNWGLMHPDFSQRLLLAFKIMKERHGYDMALLEGYRSPARQDLLASDGRRRHECARLPELAPVRPGRRLRLLARRQAGDLGKGPVGDARLPAVRRSGGVSSA